MVCQNVQSSESGLRKKEEAFICPLRAIRHILYMFVHAIKKTESCMLELQGESGDENEVQAPIRRKKVKVSCANTYLHSTYARFLCTYVLKTKAKSLPSNGLSFSECSSIMHMHPANVARDMYQRQPHSVSEWISMKKLD